MTDDVVVCVLSAVCCCRCLAFRDRINFFPLHLHPRRAARQLAYIFSTCTTSTLIMIAAAAAFYFISFFIFYFYLTEEVWSLGIVSPGPCRSLFIPGSIDICELRVYCIIESLQGGLLSSPPPFFEFPSIVKDLPFYIKWHTKRQEKKGEWKKISPGFKKKNPSPSFLIFSSGCKAKDKRDQSANKIN
jgi:hypothetical protein